MVSLYHWSQAHKAFFYFSSTDIIFNRFIVFLFYSNNLITRYLNVGRKTELVARASIGINESAKLRKKSNGHYFCRSSSYNITISTPLSQPKASHFFIIWMSKLKEIDWSWQVKDSAWLISACRHWANQALPLSYHSRLLYNNWCCKWKR